jgi:putative flippase GtrA
MAKNKKPVKEVIQYAVTGGAWFWSGYAMFAVCYSLIGLDIVSSKIISYLFGLAVNFVLERFWVFNDRKARKELDTVTVRYVAISTVNLGIDTGIVWGLNKLGVSPYIGQFVSAGFFTVWNYIWYKLWVFARGNVPKPKRAAAPALRRPKAVRRRKSNVSKRTK